MAGAGKFWVLGLFYRLADSVVLGSFGGSKSPLRWLSIGLVTASSRISGWFGGWTALGSWG